MFTEPITVAVLIIWTLLVATKKLRTKKGDFDLVLLVAGVAAYVLFLRLELGGVPASWVEAYILVAAVLSVFLFDTSDIVEKDRKKEHLKKLKKDHESLQERSELLRQRFVTMLDIFEDGIAFRSDDDSMFVTEPALKLLDLDAHEVDFHDFLERLHPDDRAAYQGVLAKCSRKKPKYHTHYRVRKSEGYEWIREYGARIDQDKRTMFVSVLQGLDVRKYPRTEVDILNNLDLASGIYEAVQELNGRRQPYPLVFLELGNIPALNRRYGRDIGDLMMGKYLNKLVYHFLKNPDHLFRISGIRFGMVIVDHRKYELLKRTLQEGGELANFTMTFGDVKESVYPSFGIQTVDYFDEPVDELVARTEKALDIALDENTPENYFITK